MLSANYTSENICRALGLGGFANDWQLAESDECIRVLLKPSFHREICISFLRKAGDVSVSVVAAVSQVWLQDWPVPQLTPVEQESEIFPEPEFARLLSLLNSAVEPNMGKRFVVIDGMTAHSVHRKDRAGRVNVDQNVSSEEKYLSFVAETIKQTHSAIKNPSIRNALADAGRYARLQIPVEAVPPPKDQIRTIVLGSQDETAQLLEALRKRHGG